MLGLEGRRSAALKRNTNHCFSAEGMALQTELLYTRSYHLIRKRISLTFVSIDESLSISSRGHRRSRRLLLVQLIRPLLQLLLACGFAEVVGDDRARVGFVVLKSGSTSIGGVVVGLVELVRRCGGVTGLLCNLIGQVCSWSVNCPTGMGVVRLTAGGFFFFGEHGHVD